MKTFIIRYNDGRTTSIKAERYEEVGFFYHFFKPGSRTENARMRYSDIDSIIPQDMIVASFADGSIMPDVTSETDGATDFANDTFFSDADKTPFSQPERDGIRRGLLDAERAINDKFGPSTEQQQDIHAKLDYLARKVRELDKFNWKRLLITTLVGVAVDLGFGTLIPTALLEIFKEIFAHLSERLLSASRTLSPNDRNV